MNALRSLGVRARNRLAAERDVRKWQKVLAPLRRAPAPKAERSVLFCELMTMPTTAKVEALIAGVLRLKGYRPLVLLERPDWVIEKIFCAAAPEAEFIYLSETINCEAEAAAERAAAQMMEQVSDLQELVKIEVDGFRIGRNVQSWALRQLRTGRLEDTDIRHRSATQQTLKRSLAVKSAIEKMLVTRAPDIAVFVERGYTPAGEVFDGCLLRNVDTIQWCGAPQSDCLLYKRYSTNTRGEHPLALSDRTWHRLLEMPEDAAREQAVVDRISANYNSGAWYNRQQLQDGKVILPPERVRTKLGLDPSKKTAVIFTHILYDATFFYGESLFDDYEQWLVETVRAAIANPQLNWVVKVHPVNVWRSRMDGAELVQLEAEALHKTFGALPNHVKLMRADTDINTFSLFEVADYGLTVRGTIGMELPCFGIPVVTAGSGRYSGRGFTIDPPTREEYAALLARLQDIPRLDDEAVRRARLYYHGALHLRPVPMQSFLLDYGTNGERKGAPSQEVIVTRRADEQLLETDDLGRLVHWMTCDDAPELLAHDILDRVTDPRTSV